MAKHIIFTIFLVVTIFYFLNFEASAQTYTFPEIKEHFLRERAQTGNITIRNECFGSIDDLILGTYPPLHPDTKDFFRFMLQKAILEIKTEVVTTGATIWQIYNHGFIIKTASVATARWAPALRIRRTENNGRETVFPVVGVRADSDRDRGGDVCSTAADAEYLAAQGRSQTNRIPGDDTR